MTDTELHHAFAHDRSQEAFNHLVERHRDWVYSACFRRLKQRESAEDATQAVFLALAQRAEHLSTHLRPGQIEPWLHLAARFAAANLQRAQLRRARHERSAATMNARPADTPEDWHVIEPHLEPAIDQLPASDRQAILLRFYRQLNHAQIAATLSITEDAAKKRVQRVLRLRKILSQGGPMFSATGIVALLQSHAVSPAPHALAVSLAKIASGAATPKVSALSYSILQAFKGLAMKSAAATLAFAACLTAIAATAGFVLAPQPEQTPPSAAAASRPAPAVPASIPEQITALEHQILAQRRAITSGVFQVVDLRTDPATYVKRETRYVYAFDDARFRDEQRETNHTFILSANEKEFFRYTFIHSNETMGQDLVPLPRPIDNSRLDLFDRMQAPSPESTNDPRKIMLVPYPLPLASRSTNMFIGGDNRSQFALERTRWKDQDAIHVSFVVNLSPTAPRPYNVPVEYWALPARGANIVRITLGPTLSGSRPQYVWECTLKQIADKIWFPDHVIGDIVEGAKASRYEEITIDTVDINLGVDASKWFTLESANMPAGTIVSLHSQPGTSLKWDGTRLVPDNLGTTR